MPNADIVVAQRSGLGREAQHSAIKVFCAQHSYSIAAEHREVDTGKEPTLWSVGLNSRQP